MNAIPRPEHPRPQFIRDSWVNLNGTWTCRIDRRGPGYRHELALAVPHTNPIRDQPFPGRGPHDTTISVPFAPESPLSGIGYGDFIDDMRYHRHVEIPESWRGMRIFVRFGGVDFHADLYVNGSWAGSHTGGSSPWSVDITRQAAPGTSVDLDLHVRDYIGAGDQAGGKQTHYAKSHGCHYTRTTGIWQTVWLEGIRPGGIADAQLVPDVAAGGITVVPRFVQPDPAATLECHVTRGGSEISRTDVPCRDGIPVFLPVPDPVLWYPGEPELYGLEFVVRSGSGEELDRVASYAALREISLRDGKFFVNGASVYLRLVLDQGFYSDGTWTAPSDDALRRDIELSIAAGFNGARLHQKVFESRFHYWADRLGYLTWSEWPSWGLDYNSYPAARAFLTEVREVVTHLRNHPSIIAWTPFNETGRYGNPRVHHLNHVDAYNLCRTIDPTRPVNDTSGYIHHITDIYTTHNYAATGEELDRQLGGGNLAPQSTTRRNQQADGPPRSARPFRNHPDRDTPHEGQPYILDEFGGIKWTRELADGTADTNPNRKDPTQAWGYGGTPQSEDEFFDRLHGLMEAILDTDYVAGWCYTQLTDVEQEQNGVYYYDRSEKFDPVKWRAEFDRRPEGYER